MQKNACEFVDVFMMSATRCDKYNTLWLPHNRLGSIEVTSYTNTVQCFKCEAAAAAENVAFV